MSAAGKGIYDTEVSITFSFHFFLYFFNTEKLSDLYENYFLHVGIEEESVVWALETPRHLSLSHKTGSEEF